MVASPGLVVNGRDHAGRAGTEAVLRGGIGDTARGERGDVAGSTIGSTLHLVERAGEGTVECTSGTVRGNARCTTRGVDVTGSGRDKGARGDKASGEDAWS